MTTYYQKHKTIEAFQFQGDWKTLFHQMGFQAQLNLRDLPDLQKQIKHPLIWYNHQRQITQLNYLTVKNASLWSNDRFKRRHRRHSNFGRWAMAQTRSMKKQVNTLNRSVSGQYTKAGNEIRQAYQGDSYVPIYKYLEANRTLYLGDYVVIGHRYLNMMDMALTYQWHRVEFIRIWHRRDFEAHWSPHPIRK